MAPTQISIITTFWNDSYNASDSWLPFLLPLLFWTWAFVYSKWPSSSSLSSTSSTTKQKFEFHRWYWIHNIHNVGAMILGSCSIYYNNDTIFNERIPILWSMGYFIIDLIDCSLRLDMTYSLHALFCLFLGYINFTTPLCWKLRMNSKATFCELSNPFMHLCKTTRTPWHFILFAMVFTLCRIVWIPFLMWQLISHGMIWYDFRLGFLAAFYGLNLFWYYKIIKILVTGGGESKPTTKTKES